MPKQKDLAEELKIVQTQLETDPTHWFSVLCRVRAPLYLKLIEGAIDSGGKPLAHYLVDVLGQYFEHQESGGLTLNDDQKETLQALATFWKIDVDKALLKLLDRLGQSNFLENFLRWEIESRHKRQQLIEAAKK